MSKIPSVALLLSLFFPLAADADQVASVQPVTIEDFGRLKGLGKPELSKDGRQVAFALEGRIYIVPVSSGEPRQVTSNGSSASTPTTATGTPPSPRTTSNASSPGSLNTTPQNRDTHE